MEDHEGVKVNVFKSPTKPETMYGVTLQDQLLISSEFSFNILHTIAEKVAERYVEEHFAELSAKLDQNAIANLAIADASKKIAEEIRTHPVVLHDKETKREVYQRGLLGGIRRVL